MGDAALPVGMAGEELAEATIVGSQHESYLHNSVQCHQRPPRSHGDLAISCSIPRCSGSCGGHQPAVHSRSNTTVSQVCGITCTCVHCCSTYAVGVSCWPCVG